VLPPTGGALSSRSTRTEGRQEPEPHLPRARQADQVRTQR
jgi:hypothetical protein